MQAEIMYRPSYSLTVVKLEAHEKVRVEAGSMVSMSHGVTLETKAAGGIIASLKRSLLGGESFFMNEYQAPAGGGTVTLAPALPGDMMVIDQGERALMVQSGSYVASSQDVEVDTKFGGAKTFFASEGLFLLRCSGQGTLILSSYGAIHEMQLAAGERYTVDTGHLVAFDEGIGFKVRAVGGLKSTLFSGEGLVVDLTGPGRVLMQTRSTDAFLTWLMPQVQKRMPGRGRSGFTFA
ncbi:MAG: TIGR00266 family protein [Anaerolineales bacterium]|nr:MAG: TIGR00266 family protein [Anaerolineales bacterium]